MSAPARRVTLRDATLREGLDTPHVSFTTEQRVGVARALVRAGVVEAEVVAPSRVAADLELVGAIRDHGIALECSGLIYASSNDALSEIDGAAHVLDHIDLLMPVSTERAPESRDAKLRALDDALVHAAGRHADVGAGFPHSLQCDPAFLCEIAALAIERGARRIVVYDTNGGGDPVAVAGLIELLRERVAGANVYFHAHNDLGLATANALAAVAAGARGLDVTVNGLGDRAGNAALEQVAMALHLKGFETGIHLHELGALSNVVAEASGVAVSKLAPVVGEYVHWHRSPSHLRAPGLFEAFDPALVRSQRKIDGS
ncbi:MAG TPA: homocitrate synthase [Candidatus Krumholzibacteria bacterium]|nr:homocitrate synthase [Candidatus Krumholzibacteria bacterium]